MKNALGIIDEIKEDFDFAINEGCHQWNECNVRIKLPRGDRAVSCKGVKYVNRHGYLVYRRLSAHCQYMQ